jgi:hypothetical protein
MKPKWMPKVGKQAWCEECKKVILVKHNPYAVHPHCEHEQGHYTELYNFLHNDLRQLTDDDWKVLVPGVGKVWAWINQNASLVIADETYTNTFSLHAPLTWDIGQTYCRIHNIPIKPYGWKEEK